MKIPVVYAPGTKWAYTSAASYMPSAIVTKNTGQKLADYLGARMLEPVGIRYFHWDVSPEGITPGGNGLSCSTMVGRPGAERWDRGSRAEGRVSSRQTPCLLNHYYHRVAI